MAQKFKFQWQQFNGEKERCHRKVLPLNCHPAVCPQTFLVFFFDRALERGARHHPLAFARAPTSTVSKEKILPLLQLVDIFPSLLWLYDWSTIPEGSCFVLMDRGEVLWPETILQRDSNPWPSLWHRSALPTVLWKPIRLEQTDLLTCDKNENQCYLRSSTHKCQTIPHPDELHQRSTPSNSRSLYSCCILNIFLTACLNCFIRTE